MEESEVLESEDISREEIDAEKEFAFLEELFNLNIQDEIRKLKLHNISHIKCWLRYNQSTVVKLQAGTVLNIYLMGSNKSILFEEITWKMIRDCLIQADKRKFQMSSTLVVRDVALEYKLDFYREHRRGRLIKHNSKEDVVAMLDSYRIRVFESANVTVTVVDSITKLSSAVTLPYEQYQQAKYQAIMDLSRKVKMLEMEREA